MGRAAARPFTDSGSPRGSQRERFHAAGWQLVYERFVPDLQPLREALCALGNGCFVTRGAFEEETAGGVHYPGTYLHGGYDRLQSEIAGRVIENEDLVNWPNWLPLSFRPAGGEWFHVAEVELQSFRQELDLQRGLLRRALEFRDRAGRTTRLVSRRLVSMHDPHRAALEWLLTPLDWSGEIEVRTGLDGRVTNSGVERYQELAGQHLEVTDCHEFDSGAVALTARTVQSRLRMSQAARTSIHRADAPLDVDWRTDAGPAAIWQHATVRCRAGEPLRIEKLVAIHASRDRAISEPGIAAATQVQRIPRFEELVTTQRQTWGAYWRRADLQLLGMQDPEPQLALRAHVFHLLQTTSDNTIDRDVGVPSRGLHGEAYRGHIFWDELYIFPFLNLRLPELTRSLLMYRYRRLPEARWMAQQAGYAGAMYPWQSGSDGREESQVVHLNPRSGRWIPDRTHRQRHVGAAIAFNVWQYFQATGDMEFLTGHGAEMLLEIARFWASIAQPEAGTDRYGIHDVVGPDEFHTHYPGEESRGLRNNAYTNVMASWCLRRAGEAFARLAEDRQAELAAAIGLRDEELQQWERIASRLLVPQQDGIILQFSGWEDLEELDWDAYRERYDDLQRVDRILEAEGDDVNRYRATKQADVLMLFFLFSREELQELFAGMGYPFPPEMIPRNIDYYVQRTSHGSTLSRVVHSWVMSRVDRGGSWELALQALRSDLTDTQGGTTSEGIHLGAMAGSVDLVQRCYTGIEMRDDVLWLNPRLPRQLPGLACRIRYRSHWLTLRIAQDRLHVRFDQGCSECVQIGFRDQVFPMRQGEERVFEIAPEGSRMQR